MFKKCRDFIKGVAALAKMQSAREVSHHLTLLDNCQTFYLHVFVLCIICLCLKVAAMTKFQSAMGVCYFLVWWPPNSMIGGDYF